MNGMDLNKYFTPSKFGKEYTKDDFVNAGLDVLSFKKNKSVYEIIIDGEINEITKKINTFSPIVFDSISLTLEEIFLYEMESKGYYAQDILDNN